MKKLLFAALSLAFVLGTALNGHADIITWQSSAPLLQPVGLPAGSFVNTNGTFVLGFSGTTDDAGMTSVLTGVSFAQVTGATLFSGITQNGVTVDIGNTAIPPAALRDTTTAFGDGGINDAAVNALTQGAIFDSGTVNFSNLTPGYQYEVQLILNDARTNGGRDDNWRVGLSDGMAAFDISAPAGQANLNNRLDSDNSIGDPSGDHVTGAFTADATGTQSFQFRGTRDGFATLTAGTGQINALQLRLVAVPEPSSLALLGLGVVGLVIRRRR